MDTLLSTSGPDFFHPGSTVLSTSESEHLRLDRLRQEQFVNALCWLEDGGTDKYVGGEANRVVSDDLHITCICDTWAFLLA